MRMIRTLLLSSYFLLASSSAFAQGLEVPRQHDRPPGPPVTAEEAVARMTVPEGFHVEIVAAEPDIMNPVAMAIDEQGRFWITESFEYPRREPGPGRDRIKVLEDTDGDGAVDKVTVFAEGLNIPSGIAVGHGGVWVGNAPDILFLQDTDGDLKADTSEVIVTGFGRTDTHELPNAFTWGPDGWLYGLNGVFNYCDVHYAESNPNYTTDHPGWEFTCAMWRIHPYTREFQIFAEGTSNPWGIATNHQGDFFISACVIEHLWHIAEGAYYIRQGGPYPAHTWPMESIVDHRHQKAAYCGITFFDSDNYPDYCNNVLYMGNIHGGCINADIAEPRGSTYFATPHPGFPAQEGAWDSDEFHIIRKTGSDEAPMLADFVQANDPWFMPVVQATGPDGCLYILDWYDRYHCYQDANADPAGIERERGRLYRVVYDELGRRPVEDLGAKSDDELIDLALEGHNQYQRETARRLLSERLVANDSPELTAALVEVLRDEDAASARQLRALWTLGSGDKLDKGVVEAAIQNEGGVAAWAFRMSADQLDSEDLVLGWNWLYAVHDDPRIRLQFLTLVAKVVPGEQGISLLVIAAAASRDDPLIQHVAWQYMHPMIERHPSEFLQALAALDNAGLNGLSPILPRALDRLLSSSQLSEEDIASFFHVLKSSDEIDPAISVNCLRAIAERIQNGQIVGDSIATLKESLQPDLRENMYEAESPLYVQANILSVLWGWQDRSRRPIVNLQEISMSGDYSQQDRLSAFAALVFSGHTIVTQDVAAQSIVGANDSPEQIDFCRQLLLIWAREDQEQVATTLLERYDSIAADLRPTVIEVLTQRASWTHLLLNAIAQTIAGERDDNPISKDHLNLNQLRRIARFDDEELQQQLTSIYGQIREGRNPAREEKINEMREFLNETPGDAMRGILVFNRVCGNCHKMHGTGNEVGPDITRNGRNNWDQLLSNVFDPSLVIGPGYQARQLATTDGRILTGLAVEESDEQVILKIQGGKLETIPRDQIDEYQISELSMMPEELEKLIEPQEMADLFAYLALDLPPDDPDTRLLPGAPDHER